MIPDNQWHPAILYKIGERYRISKDFEEAEKDPLLSGPVEYQEIKYNWNQGQPIVILPNGDKLRIVDWDKSEKQTNKPDTTK